MEKILEIAESSDSAYPEHFQAFLDNCLKKFEKNFVANDYLFAAVYFLILESGFTPIELPADLPECQSAHYDIRRLRLVTSYYERQVKASAYLDDSVCHVYQIKVKLGKYCSNLCELQGVPSAEANAHLIVNFFCKEPYIIRSLCLSTSSYTERSGQTKGHKYVLTNLKELSMLIKNEMAVHIKDLILTNEEQGCSSNLLCLPEVVQKKIIYTMINDPVSVQCLSSTCTYFYNFISKDSELWEKICFKHYTSAMLNKVLQDSNILADGNVFRRAFLELKMDDFKKSQRTLSLQQVDFESLVKVAL